MQTISRENLHFYFDPQIRPVISIDPGEPIWIETEDAIAGQLTPETVNQFTHAEMRAKIPCSNPVTGPIFVNGAQPGDWLVVQIEKIEVAEYAWTLFDRHEGLLTNHLTLNAPLPETRRILPIQNNQLFFEFSGKTIQVPVQPAVGTIGVAPVGERRYAFLNGNDFLGNVDLPSLGAGKSLVLPVHVAGGLLSLGDIHAVSGAGEISGGAADCRGRVQLQVELIKASEAGFRKLPQLNCPEFIGSIATGGALDLAIKMAYHDLIQRMHTDFCFSVIEAYQLLSSVGKVEIGQFLPPALHSALAFIPRRFL